MTEKNADQDEGLESPGTTKWYQAKDFWYGFVGWFVGNGFGWVLTSVSSYRYANTLLILVLLLNIGALIFFAFKKRRIALGMLAAFGLSLAVILCLGIFALVACFRFLGA
jgi:hypothetical protein